MELFDQLNHFRNYDSNPQSKKFNPLLIKAFPSRDELRLLCSMFRCPFCRKNDYHIKGYSILNNAMNNTDKFNNGKSSGRDCRGKNHQTIPDSNPSPTPLSNPPQDQISTERHARFNNQNTRNGCNSTNHNTPRSNPQSLSNPYRCHQ